MISRTTRNFRRAKEKLPRNVQVQAKEAYRLFRNNPRHPSLSFKKVHSKRPIYSVRISLNHRAIGILDRDKIVWFWIGEHDQYEQMLKQI